MSRYPETDKCKKCGLDVRVSNGALAHHTNDSSIAYCPGSGDAVKTIEARIVEMEKIVTDLRNSLASLHRDFERH